jgi:two-component system, NtrC family, sensor kinase
MNVLLADDDPTMRLLLSTMLEQGGHVVTTAAADGQAALESYIATPAPLLILDWEMPRMDGLELCRRIRATERGDEAFILVITARDKTEDLTAVLDAGADDYMSKPVTPDNLTARVRIAERMIAVNSARRTAETQLRKAQYLAGIGETSLALQHEINNPLAALLSNTSLIEAGMVTEAEMGESLATISQMAKRIADVVKKLRQLNNPTSVEYLGNARMIDINSGGGAPPKK